MKIINIIICFFLYAKLFSQTDTILIKTYYPDNKISQEYQTTLPDSTPNGNYKSYNSYGKISSIGKFKLGEKVGVWTYYSDGASATEIVEKYDYNTQTELYYNYTYEKMFGAPRFPGGEIDFGNYVTRQINKRVSKEIQKKYSGKKIHISFDIDRISGKVINVKVLPVSHMNEIKDKNVEDILIALIQDSPKWVLCKNMTEKTFASYNLPIKFK